LGYLNRKSPGLIRLRCHYHLTFIFDNILFYRDLLIPLEAIKPVVYEFVYFLDEMDLRCEVQISERERRDTAAKIVRRDVGHVRRREYQDAYDYGELNNQGNRTDKWGVLGKFLMNRDIYMPVYRTRRDSKRKTRDCERYDSPVG
jgi:hypothetical protein